MPKNDNKRVIYDKIKFIFIVHFKGLNMKKIQYSSSSENSVMQAIADPQYLFSAVNQFMSVERKETFV